MNWPLFILTGVALALFFARSQRTPVGEYIYHDDDDDDDDYEAPTPIQWGISDYQPWPGDMLFDDMTNAEYKDEIVRLWNTVVDEGETEEAVELFEEYERLCRLGY